MKQVAWRPETAGLVLVPAGPQYVARADSMTNLAVRAASPLARRALCSKRSRGSLREHPKSERAAST